ncbi:hypothetical protein C8J57DRAFT_1491860 [Mycena rebaudengoi]|nr:hypothetical protein C8J57DRAFT_1491860 [Mycena rebaudengoi]
MLANGLADFLPRETVGREQCVCVAPAELQRCREHEVVSPLALLTMCLYGSRRWQALPPPNIALRESLEAPFLTHPVHDNDLVIYYDVEGEPYPWRVSSAILADDLQGLSAPCQKATFGVDQTDTFDEAYRKAGTRVWTSYSSKRSVLVDMIGSLVVIFPTAHAGGALTLEHDSTAWTFDSAAQLSATAYVAFYSDVVHAVAPVETGYCATLTYNLFLAARSADKAPTHRAVPPPPEQAFAAALRTLLADRTFLPTGGFLADARIRTISERVGLAARVKVLYDSGETYIPPPYGAGRPRGRRARHGERVRRRRADGGHCRADGRASVARAARAPRSRRGGMRAGSGMRPYTGEEVPVHWVTRITELHRVGSSHLAYRNEPSLGYMYGNAALFARVPACC